MTTKSRLASLLLVAALLTMCIPCSFAEVANEPPMVITMLNTYFSAEPPPVDHEIFQMIEAECNAVFDIVWVPDGGYAEKINLTLASGDMPMVINGKGETRKPNMLDAQRAGVFWELTEDVLSQCQYFLDHLDPNINNVLSIDGKLYALYEERPICRQGTIIRLDWLEKLEMDIPYTAEDYDKVARAFSASDLDGNGKHDTYGIFSTSAGIYTHVTTIAIALGGCNFWKEEEGVFTPEFFTEEYQQSLDLFRGWYADNILNQDFVALTATQETFDAFQSQRSGLMFHASLDDALKQDAVYDVAPDAKIGVIGYLKTADGTKVQRGLTGHSGAFFFPKAAIRDEDTLVKVLKVFDKIAEPEGDLINAMVWGLEGRHYTIEDGLLVQTQEQKELRNLEINNFVQFRVSYDHWASWDNAKVSDLQLQVNNAWMENQEYAIMDPTLPLISDTYIERGTELDKIWQDAVCKYIMGELPLEAYQAELQKWNDRGGKDIIAEYEAAFAG